MDMSEHNILLTVSYLLLIGIWGLSSVVLIPVPLNLVLTSSLILYIGCHRSLKLLLTEENGGVPQSEKEVLSAADAYKFPFIGSAALFSLYIAFKYLDKEHVNLLLSIYFSVIGVFTLTQTFAPLVSRFIKHDKQYGRKVTLPLIGDIDARLSIPEMVSGVFAVAFSWYYFKTKHYLMNNVLGISFCIQSIERISLGSYKIGAIALTGLFFYDIFWVFGTDVMVTVAKSFDGPIKILFPRSFDPLQSSLLGLGDIVIPGLFVALLLRFDAVRSKLNPSKSADHSAFPKHYFHVNIIFYALGLVMTVLVMYFFEAAQPALLYLVPACLGSSFVMALARGELTQLLAYDEEKSETEIEKAAASDVIHKGDLSPAESKKFK